jgi:hemerythrin-like metal-binding protein
MALLTWSSKYSVGIASMDSQHMTLFNMINELHEAMMQRNAQYIAGPLLRRLADYTRRHFTAEEALMAANNYPGLRQHRELHRELTSKVEDFIARQENGELTLSIHLMNFLRDWLTTHIQQADQKYGPPTIREGAA